MNLSLKNPAVLENYKSKSQIARVLTEDWFEQQMYCPACGSSIHSLNANTKVADFICRCDLKIQLKSSKRPFGKRVVDGEHATMMNAVRVNAVPAFSFLNYVEWRVDNLFFVPGFFITPSVIEKRKPLSQDARRAGWTGCNIILDRVPSWAKIYVVCEQNEIRKPSVVKQWKKVSAFENDDLETRGWLADVLRCTDELSEEFTLQEMYDFVPVLKKLHPKNRHIEAKIRQQLQMLRDHGFIEFLGKGRYRKLTS